MVPTPMQTLMNPLMSMNPLMGRPQQVLITQQVPAKEQTVIEDIDENSRYPIGKDLAVIAINIDCDDERYVTADDGILLYTREFAMYYGQAALVEKDERRYLTGCKSSV